MLPRAYEWSSFLQHAGCIAHRALGRGIDLLFPPECVHCRAALAGKQHAVLLCTPCWAKLFPQLGPVCDRCGAPVPEHQRRDSCRLCAETQFHFHWARGLGVYQGELAAFVHRLKEYEHQALPLTAGRLLARAYADSLRSAGVELLVPVPMHWWRRLRRGVNSADLLAETLGAEMRLPVAYDLLRVRRPLERQGTLSPPQRRRNVRGAFGAAWQYHIKGARIALVDDVLTTGATASEAAWTLKQAGAEFVAVVVVARGIGD